MKIFKIQKVLCIFTIGMCTSKCLFFEKIPCACYHSRNDHQNLDEDDISKKCFHGIKSQTNCRKHAKIECNLNEIAGSFIKFDLKMKIKNTWLPSSSHL